jgi:two-component system, NtrC family, sensor kinase
VHRLLERQLRKQFGANLPQDARFPNFLAVIDTAYVANDSDRNLLERSIELASAELFDQNERLARDLEAIQRLEVELRQVDKLRAVGQLAAGIAHEINTPIQFVGDSVGFIAEAIRDLLELGHAGLALCRALKTRGIEVPELARVDAAAESAGLEDLSSDLAIALRQTTEGLDRISQIVGAMKQFGRPDQREKELADVNRCLRDTLIVSGSEVRHTAEVVCVFGELPHLPCYPGELSQVFLNLIVNAAHAIGQRFAGKSLGQITITTSATADAIVIKVSDNGGGIDRAVQSRIFEPFFTTKEVGRGTGQGLAISRSIVTDKHSGTLTFESTPGEGTTFIVTLPLSSASAAGAL